MNRSLTFFLAIASPIICAAPAEATHTSMTVVDFIDGSGPLAVSGTLSNPSGDTADWYSFVASIGDSVSISMQTTSFDAYLFLYKTPGIPAAGDLRSTYIEVAANDDSGGGTNSTISIPSLAQAGYYVIATESFSSTDEFLGPYNLTVSGSIRAIPEPTGAALVSIATVFGFVARCRQRRQPATHVRSS